VGAERFVGGYVWVKIAEPKKWIEKHRLIWMAAHGPIPRGHAVIFLDKNPMNLALENLSIVSRSELVRLNQARGASTDPNVTAAGIALAKLQALVGQKRRKK
jgi:hypothetical protein